MEKDTKQGLRMTPQRLEILNIIESLNTHPTAEDIFKLVKKQFFNISFDTVYRILPYLKNTAL